MSVRGKTFIKYTRVIFLLSGRSSSYRKIRRGWNGSCIYIARTTSSVSTGYVHYSGGVRTRYHNGIVHNLGAVFCSQRQTEGSYQIRTVVIILHAFVALRYYEINMRERQKLCRDTFSTNADETYTNNYDSFKMRLILKINSYYYTIVTFQIFTHFRHFSLLRPSLRDNEISRQN